MSSEDRLETLAIQEQVARRVELDLKDEAKQINEEKSLTRVVPSADVISGWIDQAKSLDPKITH